MVLMPFTPLHFGPGLLLKGLRPRSISLLSFAGANVVIDMEVLINLILGNSPLHGILHTLPVALFIGLLTGLAIHYTAGQVDILSRSHEFFLWPAVVGGSLGGASQPLLDALVFSHIQPFWPFHSANPFYTMVSIEWVRLICTASGIFGGIIIVVLVLWSRITENYST